MNAIVQSNKIEASQKSLSFDTFPGMNFARAGETNTPGGKQLITKGKTV